MAWYDVDLGGMSQATESIGGLFDNANAFGQQSMNSGVDWGGLGQSVSDTSNMYNQTSSWTPNSSFFSGLGNSISSGMDWLGKNQDSLKGLQSIAGVGGGLFDAYTNYKSANQQADYAQGLLDLQKQTTLASLAEQDRQVDKEETAIADMQTGFKKSAFGNYYNV